MVDDFEAFIDEKMDNLGETCEVIDYINDEGWELLQDAGGKEAFSVLEHGIDGVMKNDYYSHKLVESWSKPNTHSGKPIVCSQKCGTEFDAFKEQFTK